MEAPRRPSTHGGSLIRGVPGDDVPTCGRPRRQDDLGEHAPAGTGEPCRKPVAAPGDACRLHGGATPAAVAAAARRRIELEASRLLAAEDIAPVTDPVSALELHAGEVLAWRDLLRRRLGDLDPEDWRWTGNVGQEELHATVALYERSLDRAAKLLTDMTKIGIAGRRQQLEEQQHALMTQVVEEWLRRRGHDPSAVDVRSELHSIVGELEGGQ